MDDALWQSDLSFRGPNFKLLDRITGESISINNIQSFQIGGQVFNVIELSELIKARRLLLFLRTGWEVLR